MKSARGGKSWRSRPKPALAARTCTTLINSTPSTAALAPSARRPAERAATLPNSSRTNRRPARARSAPRHAHEDTAKDAVLGCLSRKRSNVYVGVSKQS